MVAADRVDGRRFFFIQIANHIERIDPEIGDRAAPESVVGAVILRGNGVAELRCEVTRIAEFARANKLDQINHERVGMHPVGEHERCARLIGRVDHSLAIVDRRGHGLFTQNGNARVKCGHGECSMAINRRRNIDSVYIAGVEEFLVLVIGIPRDVIALGLLGIRRNDGG